MLGYLMNIHLESCFCCS